MRERNILPLNQNQLLPYLSEHTVGFLSDFADVENLLTALKKNGFSLDHVDLVYGQEGLEMVDLRGIFHSMYGKLIRVTQKFWGSGEWVFLEIADEEMSKGHYLVIVETKDNFLKEKAVLLLKKHRAHEIKYFSPYYVEHFSLKYLNEYSLDRRKRQMKD